MKALILYSTRDGQTREIAEHIAMALMREHIASDVMDLHQLGTVAWEGYSCVVIGASIRYGHFQPAVFQFIADHLPQLRDRLSAFYAVNLVARKPEKCTPETNSYTRKFLLNSPWVPDVCAVFAGALRYPRYGWLDRVMIQLIMKMTQGETDTRKEVVYTDWQQVKVFAHELAQKTTNKQVKSSD